MIASYAQTALDKVLIPVGYIKMDQILETGSIGWQTAMC